MRIKVIRIGNSRGIRIPKSIIHESGINDEVELEAGSGQIIIKSVSSNRESWDRAFKRMKKNKDDVLLDADLLGDQSKWDEEEWRW